jgi:glycerophosphoryl diester phosphodiesterase
MLKHLFISILLFPFIAYCQTGKGKLPVLVQENQESPAIAAHRGGFDTILPENSIALFISTAEKSCIKPVIVELDIRASADGTLFVLHDSTVDRTTNGTGKICSLSDSYLKSLSLKDQTGTLTSEKMPLFSEVLGSLRDKNVMLMLDIKGEIHREVTRLVDRENMISRCIMLTFRQNDSRLAKEIAGKMLVSVLVTNQEQWGFLQSLQMPVQQTVAYVSDETPDEIILAIYKSGITLMTDMSESIKNSSSHFDPEYYRNITRDKHLGILITDYPVYVSTLFCKE